MLVKRSNFKLAYCLNQAQRDSAKMGAGPMLGTGRKSAGHAASEHLFYLHLTFCKASQVAINFLPVMRLLQRIPCMDSA